jgi:hypothetical protein
VNRIIHCQPFSRHYKNNAPGPCNGKEMSNWFSFGHLDQRFTAVAYPGILFRGGGSTNSVDDRRQTQRGSGDGSPLVRGSGGSCNLVQQISFHIVNFS